MFGWFRNHRYVKGPSNRVLRALNLSSTGASIGITVLSIINQMLQPPSITLGNVSAIITGVNQLLNYAFHTIETARTYSEIEQNVAMHHLSEDLMPNTKHIALAELGQFILLASSSFYPAAQAIADIDDENTAAIVTQIISVILMSASLKIQEKMQYSMALDNIKRALRAIAATEAQRAAATSPSFGDWFLRGLTLEKFRLLNETQLRVVASEVVNDIIKQGYLTDEEVLALHNNYQEVLIHPVLHRVFERIEDANRMEFITKLLAVPANDLHPTNLDNAQIATDVLENKIYILFAVILKAYHTEVVTNFIGIYNAIIEDDSMGETFYERLKQHHIAKLKENPIYYQAIIENHLTAQDFLSMSEEDLKRYADNNFPQNNASASLSF